MALKDDIAGIKQEIGTEEQFLESIIKSELFIKKYKNNIKDTGSWVSGKCWWEQTIVERKKKKKKEL